jgi:hypothetical protein
MNKYYEELKKFQVKICEYVRTIFECYGNELLLMLQDYNLLTHDKNCLESSTAFGYIIEEFVVSKLETYSNTGIKDYKIFRNNGATTASSYDCFSNINENIKALVNIKADKKNNDAVAAINRLWQDYTENEEEIKGYLILKVNYHTAISRNDNERKIFIDGIDSYYLDEVDYIAYFNKTGKIPQDHRNWSPNAFNANSGRLQCSNKIRADFKRTENEISFKSTLQMIKTIFEINAEKK